VQYEDGDKEEFTPSQLKKKGVLQPEGEGDRTDFEELDRLYALAKAEWAAGNFPPPHKLSRGGLTASSVIDV